MNQSLPEVPAGICWYPLRVYTIGMAVGYWLPKPSESDHEGCKVVACSEEQFLSDMMPGGFDGG